MTTSIRAEWAINHVVLAKLSRCPSCGKSNVKMRNDWTLYEHAHGNPNNRADQYSCEGPSADWLFDWVLAAHDLDARSPAWVQQESRKNT